MERNHSFGGRACCRDESEPIFGYKNHSNSLFGLHRSQKAGDYRTSVMESDTFFWNTDRAKYLFAPTKSEILCPEK